MKIKYTLLASAFLFSLAIHAQTFTNFTISEGLVNNSVKCVAISEEDVVWFGTQEGVSMFNGSSWETYTTTTDMGLVHNTISAIFVRENGDVWVGSDYGASKFDGSLWTTYTESDGLGDPRVKIITESPNGDLWFGDYDGLTIFDGTNWSSYGMSDGLPFGGIVTIDFDSNGDAWLGSGLNGLIKFDGTTFTEYTENEGLLNDIVRSVAIDNNDQKWVATADGISVFGESNNWSENHTIMLELPAPDTLNPTVDIAINSNGYVWAGIYVDYLVTEGGVAMYNGEEWLDFDVSDGLVGPVVRALAIDSEDNVWVATSTGVTKISDFTASTSQVTSNNRKIFPNPTNGTFHFNTNDLGMNTINIRNITGQLISAKQVSNSASFELLEPAGLYFVEMINSNNEKSVVNLIKK